MSKINPFKPQSPAPIGMFAGRYTELVALEKGLYQTKNNNGSNFLITGERGIGKSSLMMCLKHVSDGSVSSFEHENFNFIKVNVAISDRTNLVTLIQLIEINITRELGNIELVRGFLDKTWAFVQRIKVMDSGIERGERCLDSDVLIDQFTYSLSETCKRITNPEKGEDRKDGIVFLIDEADNASSELRIGYFFKSVTELLQQHNCNNIMFVLAGLPETVEKLSQSHESSVRIFSHLKIDELSPVDRHYVIDKGIESANEKNEEKTTISEDAKKQISLLSEGYPHFIQQFAFSAFEYNSDSEISKEDVISAAFKKGGALDEIGNRYYASDFYEKIKSDEYRQVLEIMSEKLNSWVKKSEIREKFNGDNARLSNALTALTSRKIILKNTSKMGEYRLQHKGFALWIKLFGNRGKNDIPFASNLLDQ